jgi:ABC transporter substrate binding protein
MIVRRRDFITLGSAATIWPLAASAQEPGRVYRLGSLHQAPHDAPNHVAFFAELQRAGFIEDQNLLVEMRGYGTRPDQFAELARAQIDAKVDVMLCGGEAAGRAAQQATATIPIVVLADDVVQAGLASSLAKPISNITGVSILATELDGKRQEILMEAVAGLRHIAALADPTSSSLQRLQELQDAARARGVKLFDPPNYPTRRNRPCNRRGEGNRRSSAQRSGVCASLQ